eukprot:6075895-Prymnesium_polylepis.2
MAHERERRGGRYLTQELGAERSVLPDRAGCNSVNMALGSVGYAHSTAGRTAAPAVDGRVWGLRAHEP